MKTYLNLLFVAGVFACAGYSAVTIADASTLAPKCKISTEEGDTACWMEVQSHNDCYVWNRAPGTDGKLTHWTGKCADGLATGKGEFLLEYKDGSMEGSGELVDGKMHGRWIEQLFKGKIVATGSYVMGEEDGEWEFQYADGHINDAVYDKGKEISSTPRFNPKFVIKGHILHYNTDLAATAAGQEITSYDFDFFQKVLKENPDIKVVYLTSAGGGVEPASDISDLIIDYDLDTHVIDICFSACTTLLLAGNSRTLEKESKIGFHRSRWDVGDLEAHYEANKEYEEWDSVFAFATWVHEYTQENIYNDFEFLLARGVDPLFAIKTLKTEADDDWYPHRKELLDANFLTE